MNTPEPPPPGPSHPQGVVPPCLLSRGVCLPSRRLVCRQVAAASVRLRRPDSPTGSKRPESRLRRAVATVRDVHRRKRTRLRSGDDRSPAGCGSDPSRRPRRYAFHLANRRPGRDRYRPERDTRTPLLPPWEDAAVARPPRGTPVMEEAGRCDSCHRPRWWRIAHGGRCVGTSPRSGAAGYAGAARGVGITSLRGPVRGRLTRSRRRGAGRRLGSCTTATTAEIRVAVAGQPLNPAALTARVRTAARTSCPALCPRGPRSRPRGAARCSRSGTGAARCRTSSSSCRPAPCS